MEMDYYTLDTQTLLSHHPIPHINNILDSFYLAHYFNKLDLFSGYHQLCIEEGHQYKTAFLSLWGLYEYTTTPLGLSNTPATFKHLMN